MEALRRLHKISNIALLAIAAMFAASASAVEQSAISYHSADESNIFFDDKLEWLPASRPEMRPESMHTMPARAQGMRTVYFQQQREILARFGEKLHSAVSQISPQRGA